MIQLTIPREEQVRSTEKLHALHPSVCPSVNYVQGGNAIFSAVNLDSCSTRVRGTTRSASVSELLGGGFDARECIQNGVYYKTAKLQNSENDKV